MGVLWKKNYPPVRGFYVGPESLALAKPPALPGDAEISKTNTQTLKGAPRLKVHTVLDNIDLGYLGLLCSKYTLY